MYCLDVVSFNYLVYSQQRALWCAVCAVLCVMVCFAAHLLDHGVRTRKYGLGWFVFFLVTICATSVRLRGAVTCSSWMSSLASNAWSGSLPGHLYPASPRGGVQQQQGCWSTGCLLAWLPAWQRLPPCPTSSSSPLVPRLPACLHPFRLRLGCRGLPIGCPSQPQSYRFSWQIEKPTCRDLPIRP